MGGLVQGMNVESDSHENLRHALAISMSWHSKGAVSYRVGNEGGADFIELLWYDDKAIKLPFILDTQEKVFCFVRDWLSTAKYGECPDTDGDTERGWCVKCGFDPKTKRWVDFYCMCRVEATWIVYSK
jgi:hypothetical protein